MYFDCGPVILGVLDYSKTPPKEWATPTEAVSLATADLEGVHRRAQRLGGLSAGSIHGSPAGEMLVRPWGERSFYAEDPAGNPLCFVDVRTRFTGTPQQIAALAAARAGR